jgi:hypothetical protein
VVGLAVVKGAVTLGAIPTLVMDRPAPVSLGVKVMELFNPAKHPAEKKIVLQKQVRFFFFFFSFLSVSSINKTSTVP